MMGDNKDKPESKEYCKKEESTFAKKKIKEIRSDFEPLFEYTTDGYFISDLKGNIVGGNRAAERLAGYTRRELIGKNYLKPGLLPLSEIPKAKKALGKIKKGVPAEPVEFNLIRKNKKKVDIEITVFPIKMGGECFVLGIARDISKRKHLERELQKSEKEKTVILNSSPVHLVYFNKNNKILWANRAACDYIKKDIKEIKGKRCYQLWESRENPCECFPVDRIWKTGKVETKERKTKDGRYWLVNSVPVKGDNGDTKRVLKSALDITEQKRAQQRLKKTTNAIIEAASKMVGLRDPYTAGHQLKVSQLAVGIARELNLSSNTVKGIKLASLVHDIGKLGIPLEILNKPSALDNVEFSFMKRHSELGYSVLRDIDFPYPIAQIVLQHHERIDGSGYPQGLKGEDILLEAKILAVADVVEATSSHRPYRAALGVDAALEEITKNRSILYEPVVVGACLRIFREKGFKFA